MKEILVVEDDKEINNLLCVYLESQGYHVSSSDNGIKAIEMLRLKPYDMLLLDLMLPYESGDRVLKKLREFSQVPVIVLSAKSMVQTKIDIIRLGADDYITKPFDLDEVLVRMEALFRRNPSPNEENKDKDCRQTVLIYRDMRLDRTGRTVTIDGQTVPVTAKEYAILELLLSNQNKLFSKANLFESVWDEAYLSEDSTLKVHMSNLRNKLKKYGAEDYIETVWGMGYRMRQI